MMTQKCHEVRLVNKCAGEIGEEYVGPDFGELTVKVGRVFDRGQGLLAPLEVVKPGLDGCARYAR